MAKDTVIPANHRKVAKCLESQSRADQSTSITSINTAKDLPEIRNWKWSGGETHKKKPRRPENTRVPEPNRLWISGAEMESTH